MNAAPPPSISVTRMTQPRTKCSIVQGSIVVVIYLNCSFPPTPLAFKWSLMISAVACAPCPISIQTHLADRVLTITTLRIGIEVPPNLKVSTFTTESATRRGVVLPEVPPHRLNCHLYECMLKTNAMALAIVLLQSGYEICEECQALQEYECPDQWFHEETGSCSDCDAIVEIREEHHENCAMRALCKLALTCSDLARRAPGEKYFIY